ncbi:MAG: bifunctional folylpolyglutamate synthase/dihydrofolate synthase [Bacteroidaceae bacterium]|nr:bifunctional folylpolyglutamate synthase/dihydrofolate synthase [Bacteroidaceae bacterium]
MTYEETIEYLFNSAPLFQHVGKDAYKEGLDTTHRLDAYFNHPHRKFKTIHVAGTNGKGSCSHTLAAILQSAGYKVGLYTSPHLVDFRERIRVNGAPVSKEHVIHFVSQHRSFFEPLHPSFFELSTAMAFNYFAEEQVDIAVIEVGLGGRLDCTNIIRPDMCVITNISFDHVQFLGETLAKIASEKAGIIKPGIPVVIGETTPETKPVFAQKALQEDAPIHFAEEEQLLISTSTNAQGKRIYQTKDYTDLEGELGGLCQIKNTNTLLSAIRVLQEIGYNIKESHVRDGFARVCSITGLMGRWQKIQENPMMICDTGHNKAGIQYIVEQLSLQTYQRLHIVMGMVNDKDISGVLAMLPKEAIYYFTKASVNRALDEKEVQRLAGEAGLKGETYPSVKEAVEAAQASATPKDFIFVGGSTFIVADLMSYINPV